MRPEHGLFNLNAPAEIAVCFQPRRTKCANKPEQLSQNGPLLAGYSAAQLL
jgi:hypothetical protein